MTERPLRILTIANVPPDPNSGAAGTVYHTNVALRELGHEVDEIWEDQLGPRRIKHGNLHSLLEQPRSYRREALKAVANHQYDVVMMSQPQAYLASSALSSSQFAGVILNRSHGVELRADAALTEWHTKLNVPQSRMPWLTHTLQRLLRRQWRQIPKVCNGIVVPSEMDRQCLIDEVNARPEQVRTNHHGVLDAYQQSPQQCQSDDVGRFRKLLYVGQYSFIKGPHILAQILNQVLEHQKQLSMTWVTSRTAHEEIRSQLQKDVQAQVTLLDWMPQDELINIYDEHGLFIFPSFMEGAGKAALEAMSRGLCLVSSDTGGMRDYIEQGVNGWVCPVGDVAAFSNQIEAITNQPDKMSMIGEAARLFACDKTWKRCAEGIVQFSQELLQQRAQPVRIHTVYARP